MKTPSVALAVVLFTYLGGLAGSLAASDQPALPQEPSKRSKVVKKPVLKIDASPVDQIKSPVVTSYADVLEGIRPAVVSVYSSKLVRQQVPDFLRQQGLKGGEKCNAASVPA